MTAELEHKLLLKRMGSEEFNAADRALLTQAEARLAGLNGTSKGDKKEISALQKDKVTLEARLGRPDAILASIGGQLTDMEAKKLILQKLYDLANRALDRYLEAEKRALIGVLENIWDKYAVSRRELEAARVGSLKALDDYLKELAYLR